MAGYSDGCRHSFQTATIVVAFTIASTLPCVADAQLVRNTVGMNGDFLTIQAGIDACGSGVICSVNVEVGTYAENLDISSSLTAASIAISGGWDATFATRSFEAADTTIEGGGLGRVIEVRYPGELSIDGFTITGGSANNIGGGVWVIPSGVSTASTSLSNLRITGNLANSTGFAQGGGVGAELDGSEHLEIVLCNVYGNIVSGTGEWDLASP